jgi:type I restriction enzyme S subunit
VSTLLKFARFKDFYIWDVKRNLSSLIYSDYEIVTLGHYIQEEKAKVKPFEYPNDDFKILGVSNKIGLFDNEIKKGKDINQAYKIVKDGFLAFNPYRINVGSIGLKTKEQKNDLISPAYVVFSCKKELLPEYLFLIFKTDIFNEIIRANTKGSVRQTLSYEILESLKIPLPPLEVQKELIKEYQDRLDLANTQEQQAKDKEKEIEEYLYKELGIEIIKGNSKDSILNFVRFKDLDRWDTQSNSFNLNQIKSKFEFIKVRKIIENSQYGLSEKANLNVKNTPMLRMNNIINGELDISSLKYIQFTKKLDNYILNKNDVLFNRTNSKELVGKCAVFKLDGIYTFASYLIRVKLNFDLVEPNYFVQIINSFIGRKQINAISRQITGQVNINAEELKNFVIPNPPLETQYKIAKHISKIKDKIKNLKEQSIQNKTLALKEFENKVFNEA